MILDREKAPGSIAPDPFWTAAAIALGWPEWQVELLCNIAGPYTMIDTYGAWIMWRSGRIEYYRRDPRSMPVDIRPHSDEGSWSLSEYSTRLSNKRQRDRLLDGFIEQLPEGDSMPPCTYGACKGCGKVGLIDVAGRRCGSCGRWAANTAQQPDVRLDVAHASTISIHVTNTTPDPPRHSIVLECDAVVLETESATLVSLGGGYVVAYPPVRAVVNAGSDRPSPTVRQSLTEPQTQAELPPAEVRLEPPTSPPTAPPPTPSMAIVCSADEVAPAVSDATGGMCETDEADEPPKDLPWMTEALNLGWPESQVRSIRAHWASSTKMVVTKYVITIHLKSGIGSCTVRRRDDFDRVIDEERQRWNAIGGRPPYISSSTESFVDLEALDRRTYRCLPCARDGLRRDGLHKHPKTREYVCDDWEQIHPAGERHTELVAKMLADELSVSARSEPHAAEVDSDVEPGTTELVAQEPPTADPDPPPPPPPQPSPPRAPKLSSTIKNQLLLW